MDGVRSSDFEWTDSLLAAESGDNKLYITNDDKYLYIMAEIVQSAQSPVYNLQIRNGSEGDKFYWLYYQSNGFVYFNNGSSDGCECKRSGNYVEFQIPFGSVMNIEPGTVLSSVRVSIQDSSNEWVNVGEVTAKDYTVTDTFYIYSACKSVNLKQHDSISFGAACSLDTAQYQWLFNGEEIAGANSREYTVEDASADDCGTYSVQITAESGAVKTADICIINNVYSGSLKGDVNGDGTVNTADTALLGKYLTCTADISELVYDNCDMNDDTVVNIFDLVMVKRIVCAD
jgi:hypothetical protein